MTTTLSDFEVVNVVHEEYGYELVCLTIKKTNGEIRLISLDKTKYPLCSDHNFMKREGDRLVPFHFN